MKLHKFVAANASLAMAKIQESLGPDAFIFKTRTVAEGVEILAGVAPNDEPQPAASADALKNKIELDYSLVEKLNGQLHVMNESVRKLSHQVNSRLLEGLNMNESEQIIQRNLLYYHLAKLGFRGDFAQNFVNDYLWSGKVLNNITENEIEKTITNYIVTEKSEFINKRNICALVGPTGVGKTTTIAKLAKRYLEKYEADSLGFITTDRHDITAKNQLIYYSNLFNVQMEAAHNSQELSNVLTLMKKKRLILIDTHGVSQRDDVALHNLIEMLESQGNKISTYLTIPCNVQEQILDEIARAFKTINLRGCILTKQDESLSLSAAINVTLNHHMPIAYLCNGQNIETAISHPDAALLMHMLTTDSSDQKAMVEEMLGKNLERLKKTQKERIEKPKAPMITE